MSGIATLRGCGATLRVVRRILGGDFARQLAALGPGRGAIRRAAGWKCRRRVWLKREKPAACEAAGFAFWIGIQNKHFHVSIRARIAAGELALSV